MGNVGILKIVYFLFIIFLPINLFSQSVEAVILPQGHEIPLSGYGFENNNVTSISNIGASNPALLKNFDKFSCGISKQYNTNIKEAHIAGIGYKFNNNWMPQSAGIVLPYNKFFFGLGFSQPYNASLDIGAIQITTAINPDGTGEFFIPVIRTSIESYSFISAFSLENLISEGDRFSSGIQISMFHIFHQQKLNLAEMTGDFTDISWSIGFNYETSSNLELSLFYNNGLEFSGKAKIKPLIVSTPPVLGRYPQLYQIDFQPFNITGSIPSKLSLGLATNTSDKLIISGNIVGVFWNNYYEYLDNQLDLSLNFLYNFTNFFNSTFGIYSTNRSYNNKSGVAERDNNYQAFFLALGTLIKINNLQLEFAWADSHLFSDEWRKQTIIKAGAGYSF